MKPKPVHLVPACTLVAIVLVAVVGSSVARAQSGGAFDLTWYSIDGGGQTSPSSGRSTGGSFALSGTIGQPDAGPALSGGAFGLGGGFWFGGGPALYRVYLPIVVRAVQ